MGRDSDGCWVGLGANAKLNVTCEAHTVAITTVYVTVTTTDILNLSGV